MDHTAGWDCRSVSPGLAVSVIKLIYSFRLSDLICGPWMARNVGVKLEKVL